jgi:hypothetical protein
MTPHPELHLLEVSRADLIPALKTVARAIGKREGNASLRLEAGSLCIEAADTVAEAPARGTWPIPVFVDVSWVRRAARRLPAGDPIHLHVEGRSLYVNWYSESCARTPGEQPASAKQSVDGILLISDAASILRPLRVERPVVENLVVDALSRGTSAWSRGVVAWSVEEKEMRIIVEDAWMKLAPFGVGMTDIRRLVDQTLRDAWKTNQEK